MSLQNFLGDIASGNFSHAWQRLEDFFGNVPPYILAFAKKAATDEGKILSDLALTAAQDVISGGLTTASFVAAAKDVESKLIAQSITALRTDIFAELNLAVGRLQAQ